MCQNNLDVSKSATEPSEQKTGLSRRKMLGGALAAGASLPFVQGLLPRDSGGPGSAGAVPAHAGHGDFAHAGFAPGRTVDHRANGFNPTELLRDFDYGKTRRLASGRVVREWEIVAQDKEIEVAPGVKYEAWTYNGRVPGPTLRAREGERLRLRFINASEHPHTIHFHGIHTALMDGMPGIGENRGGGAVAPGPSSPTSSTPSRSASTSTTATYRRSPATSRAGSTAPS